VPSNDKVSGTVVMGLASVYAEDGGHISSGRRRSFSRVMTRRKSCPGVSTTKIYVSSDQNGQQKNRRTSFQKFSSNVSDNVGRFYHTVTGRLKFSSAVVDETDPFEFGFRIIGWMQENCAPLIFGVVCSIILANTIPNEYSKTFTAGIPIPVHSKEQTASSAELSTPKMLQCVSPSGGRTHSVSFHAYGQEVDHVCTCVLTGCTTGSTANNDGNYGPQRVLASHQMDVLAIKTCNLFGHPLTIHFIANDIIMVFFFGLAAKEVTEALMPGGCLNPPSRAGNPLMATFGGVVGPIFMFFILLNGFWWAGMFTADASYDELSKGWGIVTATDIPLAWLTARLVFGNGHPAIDYLLLLAVADDAIGLVIIAVFYPIQPPELKYLSLNLVAMFLAFIFRKWHYRKERKTHQSWVPYVCICGVISWIGLSKAHLHPALALVPIVPFMPGPLESLQKLSQEEEEEIETLVTGRKLDEPSPIPRSPCAASPGSLPALVVPLGMRIASEESDAPTVIENEDSLGLAVEAARARAALYLERSKTTIASQADGQVSAKVFQNPKTVRRATSIQHGLYSGIIGHGVNEKLKVKEYDEAGREMLHSSTLDEFEHTFKIWVDFGMFFFAMANAGVKFESFGTYTVVITLSLVLGKYLGIYTMYTIAKRLGFPAPLGIRACHIHMVGLIAAVGFTVALFVSDVAFKSNLKLKGDAKMGAMLSGVMCFACYAISKFFNFSNESVAKVAKEQLREDSIVLSKSPVVPRLMFTDLDEG